MNLKLKVCCDIVYTEGNLDEKQEEKLLLSSLGGGGGGALSSTLFPQDSSGSSKKGTKNQNYLQGEVADRQAT